MHWKPSDIIAIIIITGCMAMILLGYNGAIKYTLLGVTAGYYGIDLTPWTKLGRRQKDQDEDDN